MKKLNGLRKVYKATALSSDSENASIQGNFVSAVKTENKNGRFLCDRIFRVKNYKLGEKYSMKSINGFRKVYKTTALDSSSENASIQGNFVSAVKTENKNGRFFCDRIFRVKKS